VSLSEHLLVYVSLILGIAVARNLAGLAHLLVYRDRVKFDWIFLAWGIFFFFVPAADWWDLLHWPPFDTVYIWDYFWLLIRPMLLFLICALLFTGLSDQEEVDLRLHFERLRPWLFSLGAVYTLLSVIGENLYESIRSGESFDAIPDGALVDIGTSLLITVLLIAGALSRNRAFHSFLFPAVIVLFVLLFALGG
jgi:hypothetical protein